ncbi:Wadjet anti-phage system protein JetD domain-containing protein [Marinibaculum pumilum]|uniref:Wadjet anti-phage system protein JetD domain-containing protein n=1 Tax=Marinibaculum pumilum TaxID=1766165 RepID=A0ABV7KZP5_9PROT
MSVPRFADAGALLSWMLDVVESQPDRKAAIIAHPAYEAMPSHAAHRPFENALDAAAAAGAVTVERGRGPFDRHEVARVRLIDPARLYRHLGREPAADRAARAVGALRSLVEDREATIAAIPNELATGWARREAPYGIAPFDLDTAGSFLRLLRGWVDGLHQDVDQRTFCRRAAGDSKALERKGQAGRVAQVLATLNGLEGADPTALLEELGIRKFPAPICLRGPVAVTMAGGPVDLSALRPYAALAPEQVAALTCTTAPAYLLSIENFASFNRHAREIADDGLILYSGGFPSRAVQALVARLDAALPPTVPFFHWGDIDPWGLRIFRCLEDVLARPLQPHLMDRATAGRGTPAAAAAGLQALADSDSAIAGLAAFLASDTARHLEQEEIDPAPPDLAPAPAEADAAAP